MPFRRTALHVPTAHPCCPPHYAARPALAPPQQPAQKAAALQPVAARQASTLCPTAHTSPPFCKHSGATTCLESALLSRCSVPTCTKRGSARVQGWCMVAWLNQNSSRTTCWALRRLQSLKCGGASTAPPAHSPPTPAAACPPTWQPAPVAAAPRWQRRQQPTADDTRSGGPAKWNNVVTSSRGEARNRQVHLSGYPHKHAACRTMAVHTCCAALACSSL